MTVTEPPRFRQGAGRLCLDFIRTLRYRGRPEAEEELPDAEALAAWVGQLGPCPPARREPPAAALVDQARELREAVYRTLVSARTPAGVAAAAPEDRALVNAVAAGPTPAPALDAEGRLRWHAADPVAATLALVARDALDLVSSGAIARVRDCANPACRVMFLDASRPGTRRWCSMGTCGNLAKKAALRARS